MKELEQGHKGLQEPLTWILKEKKKKNIQIKQHNKTKLISGCWKKLNIISDTGLERLFHGRSFSLHCRLFGHSWANPCRFQPLIPLQT